jgi:uncharacterized protein
MTEPTAIWSADQPAHLLVSRDKRTQALRFPPLSVGSPLAGAHEIVELPGRGTVYSYTVIHPNPRTGSRPFAVGYVDLDGPVRIFGRIEGEAAIGAQCEAAPDSEFGYAFRVVQPH